MAEKTLFERIRETLCEFDPFPQETLGGESDYAMDASAIEKELPEATTRSQLQTAIYKIFVENHEYTIDAKGHKKVCNKLRKLRGNGRSEAEIMALIAEETKKYHERTNIGYAGKRRDYLQLADAIFSLKPE